MKIAFAFGLGLSFSFLAGTASAWDNLLTHPDLVRLPAEAAREGLVDVYLREELGLERGIDEKLAVQFGFRRNDIDDDLRDPSRKRESRFERSFNRKKRALLLGCMDIEEDLPDKLAIKVNDQCTDAPGTPGFEACFGALKRFSVVNLLRNGVFAEDNPNVRARHHFHEPELTGEQGIDNDDEAGAFLEALSRGITSCIRGGGEFDSFTGRSARDRALGLDGASEANIRNFFALPDAERYLYRSLTAERLDEREHFLALYFLAVGHVLHLLQDMTSPAHVRNDFVGDHLNLADIFLSQSLEDHGKTRAGLDLLARAATAGLASRPYAFLASQANSGGSVDLALYSPSVPGLASSEALFDALNFWQAGGSVPKPGLAELVHDRFFSRNSISQVHRAPARPDCNVLNDSSTSEGMDVWVTKLPARTLSGEAAFGGPQRFLSSAQVPHLAKCRYHSVMKPGQNQPRDRVYQAWTIDESVHADYMETLFAMALDATAKFLEFYLSPRLEVIPIGERTFRLRNPTRLPFVAQADAVEVVYDTLDGGRRREAVNCGGSNPFTLLGSSESDFTCTLPGALEVPPANRADFWIVVRGRHGERGMTVAPDQVDDEWRAKDYVVAFDHVRGDEIVYGGETIIGDTSQPPGPARDAARQLDVFAVEIDPTREIGDAPPVRRNLTEAARAQATDDFSLPVPMPFGDVIALRTDLGLPAQYDDLRAQEGLFFDVARLEPSEEGAPVVTPLNLCVEGAQGCVPSRTRSEIGASGWLDWSRDGRFLFFYVSGLENDLYRHDTLAGHAHQVSPYQGADPLLTEPPEGYEREFCRALEWGSFSARSESELAVTVACHRNRVTVVRGPNDFDTADLRKGWDVFSTLLIPEPLVTAGMILESAPAKRLRLGMEPLRVDDCGGGPVCGATEDDDFEMFPVWSPDGTKLALLRLRGEPLSSSRVEPSKDFIGRELYVADVYESGATGIRKILELSEGEGFIVTPTWSPGGEWIAFGIEGGPHPRELYVVRTDGEEPQAPRRVTKGAGVVDRLVWRATTPLLLP